MSARPVDDPLSGFHQTKRVAKPEVVMRSGPRPSSHDRRRHAERVSDLSRDFRILGASREDVSHQLAGLGFLR